MNTLQAAALLCLIALAIYGTVRASWAAGVRWWNRR